MRFALLQQLNYFCNFLNSIFMTSSGQLFINPVTGEWTEVLTGSADTDARHFRALLQLPGGAPGFGRYFHPNNAKRLTVRRGHLSCYMDGRWRLLNPGESLTLAAGVVHDYHSAGHRPVELMVEIPQAERYEQLLLQLYGLAHEGYMQADGGINRMQMALLLDEFADVIEWVDAPATLRLPFRSVMSTVARRRGYASPVARYTAEWVHQRSLGDRHAATRFAFAAQHSFTQAV